MTFLGESLRCSLGFALPDLRFCSFGCHRRCRRFRAVAPNCARSSLGTAGIASYTGKMATRILMPRNKLLEKAEKPLLCLARPWWVVVLWRQVITALQNPPSLPAADWVQCSFPGIAGGITLSSPKWGEMMALRDHTAARGRPFSLGYITDLGPFRAKHRSASSTGTQELVPALC